MVRSSPIRDREHRKCNPGFPLSKLRTARPTSAVCETARCLDLLDDLYAGLAAATYPQRLKRWAAQDLLIIDDVGLGQVRKRDDEPRPTRSFNLIDRRHVNASTAFTSNIKLSAWA